MSFAIPVFVSAPSVLNTDQKAVYDFVMQSLVEEKLQSRSLGRSDYPRTDPLTEVCFLARACYGGVIMGFSQVEFDKGVSRRSTPNERAIENGKLPTPWNQIEAGILTALRRPTVVFVEHGIDGGVFDNGAFGGYLLRFSPSGMKDPDWDGMRDQIRYLASDVRQAYRGMERLI